jgi:hypothetical protein
MTKKAYEEIAPFPPHGTESTLVEAGFQRFLPLPTPTTMKDAYLFGIPLRSPLTKQTLPDSAIQMFITQAISEIEHDLTLFISPIVIQDERHNYHWHDFSTSFGFLQLSYRPVMSVSSLKVALPTAVNNENLVEWPINWVKIQREPGILQLVPLTGAGSVLTAMVSSGAVFPIRIFSAQHYPQFWSVTYTVGFQNDQVPALIVELICVSAALKILNAIGPAVMPFGNYSIGIDGLSQSTSLPGPGWLNARIQGMVQQKAELTTAAKKFYQHSLYFDVLG